MDQSLVSKQKFVPVDAEDLIRAVEKHRAIWDIDDGSYHNKCVREEAWDSVCLSVVSDWGTLAQDEKYARLSEIKKKWNNIRDYYKKLVFADGPPEGQVHGKKRRYLYDNLLEFIRPVYDKTKSKSVKMRPSKPKPVPDHSNDATSAYVDDEQGQSSDSEAKDDDGFPETLENVTFVGVPSPEDGHQTSSPEPIKQTKPLPRRRRYMPTMRTRLPLSNYERSIVQGLETKTHTPKDDPDLLFLRSLLPDMKRLTDSQKFDFKLGIMKLYRNISKRRDSEEQDQFRDTSKSNAKVKMELEGLRLLFDDEDD